MLFIVPPLLVLVFVICAVCYMISTAVTRQEVVVEQKEERSAKIARLLHTPGNTLYCPECDHFMMSPLSDYGCPKCHIAAFVIPISDDSDPVLQQRAEVFRENQQADEDSCVPVSPTPPAEIAVQQNGNR